MGNRINILEQELAYYNKDSDIPSEMTTKEYQDFLKKRKSKKPKAYTQKENAPIYELDEKIHEFILYDLPKWSTNVMYAGTSHYNRHNMKKRYKQLLSKQIKGVVTFKSIITYEFYFKSRALDATNCSGMVKLIEDCIVVNDSYKMIGGAFLHSGKTNEKEHVIITIFPENETNALANKIREIGNKFKNMKFDTSNKIIL